MGQEDELALARHLLGPNRLLALTGPGGCGKTRLSIALAASVMGAFPGGVHFAAISDASLLAVSIAQGMGLQDSRGGPPLEHLNSYLGDGKLLLVLDNFEHVLSAAPAGDLGLQERHQPGEHRGGLRASAPPRRAGS